MVKKVFTFLFIAALLIGAYIAWSVFGPTVKAPGDKFFYIHTGTSYRQVKESLIKNKIIRNGYLFDQLSKKAGYQQNIRPGKYEIKNGSSLYNLVKMLRSGRQSPVRLVINKLRTKEDLAQKIANHFEVDSLSAIRFLLSNDSLKRFGLDTNTAMTAIIPNTYLLKWNTPFEKLFQRLDEEQEKFWTPERREKARAEGLTPGEVYSMASIIEEETNDAGDKAKIASVYLNRMRKGMRLEADPTIKYAMRNFALKRILRGHLDVVSPYNTYRNTGLPPGPICTPSAKTIDAVLNAPETNYLFFVASPSFDGSSNFAETYSEHLIYAKAYQKALDSLILSRK